jgi:hypothetical protein
MVMVDGVPATVINWSPYFIQFTVPNVPAGTWPLVLLTTEGNPIVSASLTAQ